MLNHKAARILQIASVVIVSLMFAGSAAANQFDGQRLCRGTGFRGLGGTLQG